ncbi:hypothetical protein [Aquitalea sp. LB_tupeE]|uniref:hypothetical protein n=1 Tax=Aquitalea sp. LB_tupeE TaxID=2748078 RepID=UPI0015B99E45|nr:hypothetical protein [Aquitalea sp. LB_tupeE]NWK76349.1 hypothetical protein [Aquitalea sp. LB_tupeE]
MNHHWQSRLIRGWQQRPTLHRDGVSLQEAWLLRKLQQALNGDALQIDSLSLLSRDSTLHLTAHQPLAARLTLHFDFLPIVWHSRQIRLHYHVQGEAISPSTTRRLLGGLLLGVMEGAFGHKTLQQLAKPLDWLTLEQDIATIHLDALDRVRQYLDYPLLGKPLAARLTIKAIETSPGLLRIRLSRSPSQTD